MTLDIILIGVGVLVVWLIIAIIFGIIAGKIMDRMGK